ncbi:MAG: NGG1p interacting factor NIF3 [Candidatus Omnitrophica bacterium]|nr:NGG1p interacting factor NIF3 [Candidatus Omnitrophota bacterium]
MKLRNLYQFFIQEGIKTDLRKKQQIKQALKENEAVYNNLNRSQKKFFDKDCLVNPYADTRILNGGDNHQIKTILVGIDVEVGELLLSQALSQSGKKVDLVLGHHPKGIAWAALDDVMHLQTDLMANLGIKADIAKHLMKKRITEVSRKLHGSNHMQSVDAAKLLGIPFMCCHTPADNHVAHYLQKLVGMKKPKRLQDLVDLLLQEPEYQYAATYRVGPRIFAGQPNDNAGRVFVDMTGGASGSKDLFPRMSQVGIGTVLGMHVSENNLVKMKREFLNVVIAGHMASDSLGLNLLFDKLQKKFDVEILECSGFRRFKR